MYFQVHNPNPNINFTMPTAYFHAINTNLFDTHVKNGLRIVQSTLDIQFYTKLFLVRCSPLIGYIHAYITTVIDCYLSASISIFWMTLQNRLLHFPLRLNVLGWKEMSEKGADCCSS